MRRVAAVFLLGGALTLTAMLGVPAALAADDPGLPDGGLSVPPGVGADGGPATPAPEPSTPWMSEAASAELEPSGDLAELTPETSDGPGADGPSAAAVDAWDDEIPTRGDGGSQPDAVVADAVGEDGPVAEVVDTANELLESDLSQPPAEAAATPATAQPDVPPAGDGQGSSEPAVSGAALAYALWRSSELETARQQASEVDPDAAGEGDAEPVEQPSSDPASAPLAEVTTSLVSDQQAASQPGAPPAVGEFTNPSTTFLEEAAAVVDNVRAALGEHEGIPGRPGCLRVTAG